MFKVLQGILTTPSIFPFKTIAYLYFGWQIAPFMGERASFLWRVHKNKVQNLSPPLHWKGGVDMKGALLFLPYSHCLCWSAPMIAGLSHPFRRRAWVGHSHFNSYRANIANTAPNGRRRGYLSGAASTTAPAGEEPAPPRLAKGGSGKPDESTGKFIPFWQDYIRERYAESRHPFTARSRLRRWRLTPMPCTTTGLRWKTPTPS